jgi:hypothetical protein
MGGLTHGRGTTTFELATAFANAIGSECYRLTAPIYCPTIDSRLLLERHCGIAEVFNRIKSADTALVSWRRSKRAPSRLLRPSTAWRSATRDPAERCVDIADLLCEAGCFGQKAGRGWYADVDGRRQSDPEVLDIVAAARAAKGIVPRAVTAEEIVERLVAAMADAGQKLLAAGIAARSSDIDLVMINGYGFPAHKAGRCSSPREPDPLHARGPTVAECHTRLTATEIGTGEVNPPIPARSGRPDAGRRRHAMPSCTYPALASVVQPPIRAARRPAFDPADIGPQIIDTLDRMFGLAFRARPIAPPPAAGIDRYFSKRSNIDMKAD